MLRTNVHVSAAAAKGYYTEGLSRQDYYSEGQEVSGSWGGKGAERLGLTGQVEQSAFASLCENLHPETNKQLTPRSRVNRRVGYDFNFHCPKSVSVLHALTGDAKIVECFRSAVEDTMLRIENGMNTRIRKGGAGGDRHTGNITWAEFVHFTSRPVRGIPDPHLHAHCFVFNATFDHQEQRWKAGEFAGIKNELEYHEAAFHLNLSSRLNALGYKIERRGKNWEVAGVSPEVINQFSRRTAQIEALAIARGVTDAKLKDQLGAKSRERKAKSFSISELRQEWRERISGQDFALIQGLRGGEEARPQTDSQAAKTAVRYAVDHCFARKSVVPESKLRATAIRRAISSGATLEAIERELQTAGLIRRDVNGRVMVTTAAVLAEEQRMVSFVRSGQGKERPFKAGDHRWSRDFLGADQKAAVRHILTSKDRVVVIRGGAGTGKTTLMSETIEGIETGGKRVFTFAPTAIASRKVLRDEGFSGADTVARLLLDAELQRRLNNQVIWIDEAGLLSVRDMVAVFGVAAQQNARVILSGDGRQHSAVERGDALRVLESTGAVLPAEINGIRRQRGEYKRGVEALSRGETGHAFAIFDRLGFVQEAKLERIAEKVAADYLSAVKRGRSALVVSPTHREGDKVAEAIRDSLKTARLLGKKEREVYQQINLNWTDAEKSDAGAYQKGDVVQFTQNVKGLSRGERVVVSGRDSAGNLICASLSGVPQKSPLLLDNPKRFQVYRQSTLKLALGENVRITQGSFAKNRCRLDTGAVYTVKAFGPEAIEFSNGYKIPWDFGHLAYGYVTTSHAAQGRTVDEVILAQSGESFAASSREQFYVSASRGRERLTVYTDDKDALLEAVGASGKRLSASEFIAEKPKKMSLFEKLGFTRSKEPPAKAADKAAPEAAKPGEAKSSLFDKMGVARADRTTPVGAEKKPEASKPASSKSVDQDRGGQVQVDKAREAANQKQQESQKQEVKNDQLRQSAKTTQTQWDAKAVKSTEVFPKDKPLTGAAVAKGEGIGFAEPAAPSPTGSAVKTPEPAAQATPKVEGVGFQKAPVTATPAPAGQTEKTASQTLPPPPAQTGKTGPQTPPTAPPPPAAIAPGLGTATSPTNLPTGNQPTPQAPPATNAGKVAPNEGKSFVAAEMERRANKTDEDFRAWAKIQSQDAERNKAIKDQGQKQQELHKRHTATQIQVGNTPKSSDNLVQGKYTAKIVAERKGIKSVGSQPAPKVATPAPKSPTPPVKPVPRPPTPRPPAPKGPSR